MDNDEQIGRRHADTNIAVFVEILPVVQEFDCEWIAEYRTCLLERDAMLYAMLYSIRRRFFIVSFEFVIYHQVRAARILSRNSG